MHSKTMTLADVISDLKQAVQEGNPNEEEAQELADGRVILPEEFHNGCEAVEFKDSNSGRHPTSLYHLGISVYPEISLDDMQPLVD